MYSYKCDTGLYESDSWIGLMIEIIKHRTWHLVNHGKWID